MPIAAVASLCTLTLRGQSISAHSDWMPKPWAMPDPMPESSASPDDRAIVVWVLDQCFTWHPEIMQQPPLVDLLVTAQPAKSVSQ